MASSDLVGAANLFNRFALHLEVKGLNVNQTRTHRHTYKKKKKDDTRPKAYPHKRVSVQSIASLMFTLGIIRLIYLCMRLLSKSHMHI